MNEQLETSALAAGSSVPLTNRRSGFHTQFSGPLQNYISALAMRARKNIFDIFLHNFPDAQSVLDVGVTSESIAPEANFFEELYPHKERITAVGVEDASHLSERFPGLQFVQVRESESLPFATGQFDVVFSNAVLEHIIGHGERLRFLAELLRVGQNLVLAVPNKFFPVEHHTGLPFLHWYWPLFRVLLAQKYLGQFYSPKNLQPMSRRDLRNLLSETGYSWTLEPVRTWFFVSNWVVVIRKGFGSKAHSSLS